MHLLEYNNNPNASPEERLQSLKESAQRALEELETNFDESVKAMQELTKKLSDSQDKSNQAINTEILKLTGNMKGLAELLELLKKDPEEGDDDGWFWRKWKSGKLEAWCNAQKNNKELIYLTHNSGGVINRWVGKLPLPDELFTSVDGTHVTGTYSLGWWNGSQTGAALKTDAVEVSYYTPGAVTETMTFEKPSVYVVGNWLADGETAEMTATHDGAGNVTVYGVTAAYDGAGNVTINGATASHDDAGNVTID